MTVPLAITVAQAARLIETEDGFTVDERTGCWLYEATSSAGYGPYLSFYAAAFGEVPDGFLVAHMCSGARRGCVRPSHLDVIPEGARAPNLQEPSLAGELRDDFARRIRDEREARRMSRADFAKELRVSVSVLASWETGKSTVTGDGYRQIAKQLGWDGRQRRWKVVFVNEEVVAASSSGEAMRKVWQKLDREGSVRKSFVVHVRPAAK